MFACHFALKHKAKFEAACMLDMTAIGPHVRLSHGN